jgi:hypothetical protein
MHALQNFMQGLQNFMQSKIIVTSAWFKIINQSDEDLENNPNIIEGYFNREYQYTAILGLLEKKYGVKIHIPNFTWHDSQASKYALSSCGDLFASPCLVLKLVYNGNCLFLVCLKSIMV